MRNKGAEIRAKIIARITQETKDRVKKQMTCKWLFNSNECKKEPGTFCIGLKMLAEECNLSEISYIPLGIKTFIFKDGSKVGGLGAFMSAGLIKGV